MRRKVSWLIGGMSLLIVLFVFFISWYYPFSTISLSKKYTYKPSIVLYNDLTYEEMLNEFKASYEQDLQREKKKAPENQDQTVVQLEEAFSVFEQTWLMEKEPITMDRRQLEEMFMKASEWQGNLIGLLTEGDYTTDENVQLVESLNQALARRDDILLLKEGDLLSRTEMQTRLDNLRHQFHRDVEIFFTTFYKEVRENKIDL